MKKIAVFGKPGGGKSKLGRKLSAHLGIALYALDEIEYQKNGERVSAEQFTKAHADLISSDSWIIEGLGTIDSFWKRIEAADILIFVDLPYYVHYWWVTKRLLKSVIEKPEGWPEGSSVLKGTLASYKFLRLSPRFWTPALFENIQARGQGKQIYRITTINALNNFHSQLDCD